MARRRLTHTPPARHRPAAAPETKSALADPGAVAAPPTTPGAPAGPGASPPPIAQVAGQSAEAAALREVTESLAAARATGRMVLDVALDDIAPGHLARDRLALDPGEIESLKASIRAHGQRSPAEITPLLAADGDGAQGWGLISGWRRLRALSELYAETGEARFATIRALVRPPEAAADSYVAMVEENEVRVGLSYYERARVVAEAAARGVFADQSAALRTLFATASRAKRSKIASFIDIHEQLGDLLAHPAEIPERLGLALVSRLRHGEARRLRAALMEARPATAAAELALLERLATPPRDAGGQGSVSRAKQTRERLAEGVEMTLKPGPDGATTVTLTGPGVDAALVDAVRRLGETTAGGGSAG